MPTFLQFSTRISEFDWLVQLQLDILFKHASSIGFVTRSPLSLFPVELNNLLFSSSPFLKLPSPVPTLTQFFRAASVSDEMAQSFFGFLSQRKQPLHPPSSSLERSLKTFLTAFRQSLAISLAQCTVTQFSRIVQLILPKMMQFHPTIIHIDWAPYQHVLDWLKEFKMINLQDPQYKEFVVAVKSLICLQDVVYVITDPTQLKAFELLKFIPKDSIDYKYFIQATVANLKVTLLILQSFHC